MSRHRFFLQAALPELEGEVILPLAEGDLRHAVAVLRVVAGEEIDVVEPGGRVWRVRVEDVSSEAVVARVAEEIVQPVAGAGQHVTLVFGVSKGGRNDDIVEGVTELGVSSFMPVITARTVVKLDAEKRRERGSRWRRVALAASKQSKRGTVPEVSDPVRLGTALPLLAGYDLLLVAWEEAGDAAPGIRNAVARALPLAASARVAVVIGPEGGLTAEEISALEGVGGVVVSMGHTVLRVETAAVVASALAVHELGGLGNAR
jgi:16S rRNA (uracil1498-N3)-methyltransferase